ncbi:hypothetical protein [Thiohalocapsa marina]|uniref:hypothetical protein n=1 Tax=Thiohalocapsa marina TaxID=424902 RepID=UPI0036DC66A6
MSAERQRDQALKLLKPKLSQLSTLFKECYLSSGRGAVMVYASDIINGAIPKNLDYRNNEEMLALFDSPSSKSKLGKLMGNYNPNTQGIMVLITDEYNATYFITFKLQ